MKKFISCTLTCYLTVDEYEQLLGQRIAEHAMDEPTLQGSLMAQLLDSGQARYQSLLPEVRLKSLRENPELAECECGSFHLRGNDCDECGMPWCETCKCFHQKDGVPSCSKPA